MRTSKSPFAFNRKADDVFTFIGLVCLSPFALMGILAILLMIKTAGMIVIDLVFLLFGQHPPF